MSNFDKVAEKFSRFGEGLERLLQKWGGCRSWEAAEVGRLQKLVTNKLSVEQLVTKKDLKSRTR